MFSLWICNTRHIVITKSLWALGIRIHFFWWRQIQLAAICPEFCAFQLAFGSKRLRMNERGDFSLRFCDCWGSCAISISWSFKVLLNPDEHGKNKSISLNIEFSDSERLATYQEFRAIEFEFASCGDELLEADAVSLECLTLEKSSGLAKLGLHQIFHAHVRPQSFQVVFVPAESCFGRAMPCCA